MTHPFSIKPATVCGLLIAAAALAVEESDVLFFAPFEDSADATLARGDGKAKVTGGARFGSGVRGKGAILDATTLLNYAFKGNCVPDEGTIMMWVKPEWRSDDDAFHTLFRATTGNFGGKALNAIMLYKYHRRDRLQFYTSNGQKTSTQDGRTLAVREPVSWKPGAWVHVAATWSSTLANTEMFLYLNGERVAASAGAVFVPDTAPDSFQVGGPKDAGTTWFDDLLVFSRPLLAREIAEIYTAYRGNRTAMPADLPFMSSRELQLRPCVLFGRSELVVEVDYRGARRELGSQPGSVQVVLARNGKEMRSQAPTTASGLTRIGFHYNEIGPGFCDLRATLCNHSGKSVRTGQLRYEVPTKPVWLGNTLGKTDVVLPPWTPLRASGDAIEMWGRKYICGTSPLPSQVVSQESALLRSPILLTIRNDGATGSLTSRLIKSPSGNEAALTSQWEGTLGLLACKATCHIEFDGFMRLDFELVPAKAVTLDALTLVIPFRQDTATLYHHANGTWTDLSDAGGIGAIGWKKALPFVPYYWVGTERGGLAWFCEHNRNWQVTDERRAIELAHTNEGVDLTVRFLDKKITLTEPLRLTFGFIATPVKPMPRDWRNWRQTSISTVNLESFPAADRSSPGCRNIGDLWQTHVGSFSYLPADPPAMRAKVKSLRDQGWQTILSYFALDHTQADTPDYRLMEREWRRNPYAEASTSHGISHATVCNASTWADFLVWAIAKTLDETGTDGPYLDCSNPNFCCSAEHGCAPGRYPLLATRELQKRIYTMVHQKRGEAGHVYNHNSENNIITTFAFADAVLNGEQYNRKDLRTLTLEKFRAELSWQPYGVPTFLLPTLVKFQPNKKEKMPGAEFLAYPFLHDVICTPAWLGRDSQKLLKQMQAILYDFGATDAEFLPYWDNAADLNVTPAGSLLSAYRRKDGKAALLIARGLEKPTSLEVALQGRLSNLSGASSRNALSNDLLRWTNGKLVWPLSPKVVQFAIVGVAPQR